jgi:uncharacterized protein (TIGR03000 family)
MKRFAILLSVMICGSAVAVGPVAHGGGAHAMGAHGGGAHPGVIRGPGFHPHGYGYSPGYRGYYYGYPYGYVGVGIGFGYGGFYGYGYPYYGYPAYGYPGGYGYGYPGYGYYNDGYYPPAPPPLPQPYELVPGVPGSPTIDPPKPDLPVNVEPPATDAIHAAASPLTIAIPAAPSRDTDMTIIVKAPADAIVWMNGAKMSQTGTRREFVASGPEPGKVYSFLIRAQWIGPDGHATELSRRIPIQAGERRIVEFGPVPQYAPQPQPLPLPATVPASIPVMK